MMGTEVDINGHVMIYTEIQRYNGCHPPTNMAMENDP